MFGVSFTELIIVFAVALVVFGPEKLPQVASKIGKTIGTFKKTSDKFRREFYNSVYQPARDIDNKVHAELSAVVDDIKKDDES